MQWEYAQVPAPVRDDIEAQTGPVDSVELVKKGSAPGIAAVLHLQDGTRAFFKGCPEDSSVARLYTQEMDVNACLPDSIHAPEIQYASAAHGWLAMLFNYIDGRPPDLSPGSPDLDLLLIYLFNLSLTPAWESLPAVGENLTRLEKTAALLLSRLDAGEMKDLYRKALDGFDASALAGDTLTHYDLHPGNLIRTRHGLYLHGWARACAAAPFADTVYLTPRLLACGHTGESAEKYLSQVPAYQNVPPPAVTGAAALWTMFRHYQVLYGPGCTRDESARDWETGLKWLVFRTEAT